MPIDHPEEDEPPSTDGVLAGVQVENRQDLPVDTGESSRLVTAALEAEGYPPNCQVSVVYVDDGTIADLNQEHLGGDGPTDVISLPLEHLAPGKVPMVPEDGPPLHLGDIFIAPATVTKRAKGEEVEIGDRMALMVVHGMYHLLGWGHDDPDEAEAMEAREAAVLSQVGRRRP